MQRAIRTYTMRLNPTRRQDGLLQELLEELRELYNAALGERKDAWKTCRKHIGYYDQQRELTELRASCPQSASFPLAMQRDPLRRVDRAMNAFFRRVKAGQAPGYPRFRSRNRYDSFTVDARSFRLDEYQIVMSKLGGFRFKSRCRIKGQPKQLWVKRIGNKWVATVACVVGNLPAKIPVAAAVGIDLGIASLATLSDGTEIRNPRWTQREEARLARANRNLATKKRGSKNRAEAREQLQRTHRRIAGLRRSYLHGVSRQLVDAYDLIAYEDLTIKNMVRSNLAKSIMDAAWGELIRQLVYKAEWAGKYAVAINPRGTTQICSGCGEKVPKTLSQRWHECPHCGLSLGRDQNAALNILRLGGSLVDVSQNVDCRQTPKEGEL